MDEPDESAESDKSVKLKCEVRWAASRELNGFTTWWATFVGSQPVGEQDVYDISVPETENFLAMGVTVHNCCVTVATNVKDVISQMQAFDLAKSATQSDTAKADSEKVKNCATSLKYHLVSHLCCLRSSPHSCAGIANNRLFRWHADYRYE